MRNIGADDRRAGGFLFATGRNVPAGANLGVIKDRDLGPTICVMLGDRAD